ncbi:hypothetical protein BDN67DRAFT_51874 [Paxillus ammoniavirescens]|nr:hypothetical protein BDN67DRAFT_51874 [Paxillus ammoniavirescens]
MLPHSPHQLRNQNSQNANLLPSASFNHQNTSLDPSTYFNLDPNAAAKQMAALNFVNMQRQLTNANARQPAASPSQIHIPVGGTTQASYVNPMSSSVQSHRPPLRSLQSAGFCLLFPSQCYSPA